MENQKFDQFARESVGAPTRRTLVRGLAAVLGMSGLTLAFGDETEAGKKQKKKEQKREEAKRQDERKKKEEKREEKREEKKAECGLDGKVCAASTNACQAVACEKQKCVTSNVAQGTACGGGRECRNGACECPTGATCSVNVSPSAMRDWFGYNDETEEINNALLNFMVGPGSPLFGNGSVRMTVSGQQRKNIATYQFTGTKLSDVAELKFTTYNPLATNNVGPNASGYLHFNVDFNGSDTWQRRLVYVPNGNGIVNADQWQEWDAIDNGNAKWSLSGGVWPGDNLPNTTKKTWQAILAQYPQVRIRVTDAFLGIRIGEPYVAGFTGNVGSVTFGTAAARTRFVFGPDS